MNERLQHVDRARVRGKFCQCSCTLCLAAAHMNFVPGHKEDAQRILDMQRDEFVLPAAQDPIVQRFLANAASDVVTAVPPLVSQERS